VEEVLETALRGNSKAILLINRQLHQEVKDLDLHFPASNFYLDKEEACRYQSFDMFTKMLSKKQKHLVGSFLSVWVISSPSGTSSRRQGMRFGIGHGPTWC
jgi:hypothetical protein